ncbi:hypothetical protein BDN70DRAFT_901743 [Pholiota conissans]|uniref:Uncharacterized protein n=1 Tax=Pholiota conissans TaxID=109636 RepID=A0A9P5YLC3_9AGAR|nr:hypothetical protein BDN70DRAFT_901743 [Pholiota conissans]
MTDDDDGWRAVTATVMRTMDSNRAGRQVSRTAGSGWLPRWLGMEDGQRRVRGMEGAGYGGRGQRTRTAHGCGRRTRMMCEGMARRKEMAGEEDGWIAGDRKRWVGVVKQRVDEWGEGKTTVEENGGEEDGGWRVRRTGDSDRGRQLPDRMHAVRTEDGGWSTGTWVTRMRQRRQASGEQRRGNSLPRLCS